MDGFSVRRVRVFAGLWTVLAIAFAGFVATANAHAAGNYIQSIRQGEAVEPAGPNALYARCPKRDFPGHKMAFPAAKASADAWLRAEVGQASIDAFTARAKTVKQLDDTAAWAMSQNIPAAALAALLEEIERAPSRVALVNAAGLLGQFGRPHEALAFLDKAKALPQKKGEIAGMSRAASEANTRGFVLLELKRYDAAIKQFSRAIKLEPLLAEARGSLAVAKQCKKGKPKLPDIDIQWPDDTISKAGPTEQGLRRVPGPEYGTIHGEIPPLEPTYDLSLGEHYDLPRPVMPVDYLKQAANQPEYFQWSIAMQTDVSADIARVLQLTRTTQQRINRETKNRASRAAIRDTLLRNNGIIYMGDPVLERLGEQLDARLEVIDNVRAKAFGSNGTLLPAANGDPRPTATCQAVHNQFRVAFMGWQEAAQAYADRSHVVTTAFARHLHSDAARGLLHFDATLDTKSMIGAQLNLMASWNPNVCSDDPPSAGGTGATPDTGNAAPGEKPKYEDVLTAPCPGTIKQDGFKYAQKFGMSLDLPGSPIGMSIDVTCEDIAISGTYNLTPGLKYLKLGPMIELTKKFGHSSTLYLGAGGSSSLVGGGAGAGIYFKWDVNGNFEDAGFRVGGAISRPAPGVTDHNISYKHDWSFFPEA